MKKLISLLLTIVMVLTLSPIAFAKDNSISSELKNGSSPLLAQVSEMLDEFTTTQTVVVSEKSMVEQMLVNNEITRAELDEKLTTLSEQTETALQDMGYNEKQISVIKAYSQGEDAFNHVFSPETRASGATLRFRYGLAGANTKKAITIVYDMLWSECPFFTFTDSFGIGWIAADADSHEVVTKTDSTMAQVYYYDSATEENAHLYRNVEMDKSENGVVVGVPIIGSAGGNYGKHIGGVTEISTQSDSYNIQTIHLFVSYAHTTIAVTLDWAVALEWKKVSGAISFLPHPRQKIIVQGDHTFKYNSQDVLEADIID